MRLIRFAPALLVVAACSSGSDPVSPTPSIDLEKIFAELSVPGASAGATFVASPGVATMTFTGLPTNCPYVAASKSFVCGPTTQNGVATTYAYQFLDAAGNVQAQSDPKTTNAVRITGGMNGTLQPSASTGAASGITIAQQHDVTVSGLLGDTHRIDGTTSIAFGGTFGAGAVTSTTKQTFANVRVAAHPTGASYPLGGTITSDATATTNGQTTTVHSVLTFDGTSTASLVVTTNGATKSCKVSLVGVAVANCV